MASLSIAMKSTTQYADNLTELLWKDALRHLGSTDNEVLLPTNVVDMIGQKNVDKIKSRLCALIGAPVVSFVDESINALRILRTPAYTGTAISVASHNRMAGCGSDEASIKSRQVSMKAAKIPRPPNAFILYRQHHHPRVKETYPDLTNNQISVLLGKQWKAESEDVKLHFKNLAEEFKKKHAEDYPDYQYTPRKPSEKKRRATSRQSPKSSKRSIPAEFPPPMAVSSLNSCTVPMRSDTNDADVTVEDYMEPLNGLNIMFDPNGLATEHTSFDTNAFDALFQQVQGDYGRASLLPQLDIAEQSIGDPFGFSDFTADCF